MKLLRFQVGLARGKGSFSEFTSTLEDAHNSAHVSVGGTMSYVSTAAYDPIFWR